MNNTFKDLIDQTYPFPQTAFKVRDNCLLFHQIPLKKVIEKFGSPLKLTYLPIIGEQINRARTLIGNAMVKCSYEQPYISSYCTKSSHFAHTLLEVLKYNSHLEISSAFDTDIVSQLLKNGNLKKDSYILCNGFKTKSYIKGIERLFKEGMTNVIPILDSMDELEAYESFNNKEVYIGLRMATEEAPKSEFYSSRFGIQKSEILDFYKEKIHGHPKIKLKMLHFFVYTGIKDTNYYWNEVHKHVSTYTQIKAICSDLDSLNIGGGLPIQNSLDFDYDYQKICDELIALIKNHCNNKAIAEPVIFSEFGSFTVGESGACIFQILGKKKQNDRETWYIVDNTLISTLPDMWAKKHKFLMLPINKWNNNYIPIILGGLTCDNDDNYSFASNREQLFLPEFSSIEEEPLYIGFFHTGAYQETLSGFGGIHHCLIPAPKHILIDKDEHGNFSYELFLEEQQSNVTLENLGYSKIKNS